MKDEINELKYVVESAEDLIKQKIHIFENMLEIV